MERMAQLESQEVISEDERLAYEWKAIQEKHKAAWAHSDFGALVWYSYTTGVFVSDRFKLDQNLINPKYKNHRSIRERWQVLNADQSQCKLFRNQKDALSFAETCGW